MAIEEQTRPDEPITFRSEREMPPMAVSLGTSLANKTFGRSSIPRNRPATMPAPRGTTSRASSP